ncbi:MAG: metal ABC transporter ATP-binding protein [Oscillospiraceae bacterium]|nr:metal ABC transporter ATP-binding protein [Oscillospiraceae bacterium]
MAYITCEHLMLRYESLIVQKDLSFTVEQGDYLCIVGENGSGKSTLMKCLLGLKAADGGTMQFGDGLKRNEIGYLPQQSMIQRSFPASVREVVLSGCLNGRAIHPFYTKEEKARAAEQMECLNITQLADRCYRELSGGQQQRVLLARALCATKKLLLLDEPLTGLDPLVATELYSILQHIHDSHGITVIMVTHDVECAVRHAKTILHIGKNESFFGSCAEYEKSAVGQRFLGDSIQPEECAGCAHTHTQSEDEEGRSDA